MIDEMDKYYQILGVKREASEKEILEAYKVLVKVWQPGRFSDDPNVQKIATEKIKEIDEAFKQLLIVVAHERGRETTEPQLKIRTEPLGTRGSIVVKTDPVGAIVHFNGKPVGNSPIRGKNLSVGSHNIRVIKDGYEIWEQGVDIYAGAEKEVFAKLKLKEPESGEVWKDSGKKPYGTPTPSLFEPLCEPSSKPFQKEDLKDEGPTDGQSVKLTHGGLGGGAKVGLTVMVVLILGIINGLLSYIGHYQYISTGIAGCILVYIWSRPGRRK